MDDVQGDALRNVRTRLDEHKQYAKNERRKLTTLFLYLDGAGLNSVPAPEGAWYEGFIAGADGAWIWGTRGEGVPGIPGAGVCLNSGPGNMPLGSCRAGVCNCARSSLLV